MNSYHKIPELKTTDGDNLEEHEERFKEKRMAEER